MSDTKRLLSHARRAVDDYNMIEDGDKIAVGVSGGKDSMLMAKLIQQLSRTSEVPFEACYIVMDPGYNEVNRKRIEDNAKKCRPIHIDTVKAYNYLAERIK